METQVVLVILAVIIAGFGLILAAVKFGFDIGAHRAKQMSDEKVER